MKMNKILYKRLLIFAIAALMLISVANVASAAFVELGNPASTSVEYYVPFYGYYDYGWSAVIYLQSELGSAKDLTGVTYDVRDTWTGAPYTIYEQKVYMKHTTLTDWTGDLAKPDPVADGYTLVYEGDITFTDIGFADFIPFDTNFNYDGTSNLIIYWENWDGDYESGYPGWQYPGTSYAPDRVKYKYSDGSMPGDATSTSYYFPNIRIHYPGTHDVAVTDIVSPEASEGYGNIPVTVEIKNTGLNTESFPVNVKINSPPVILLEEGFEDEYSTRPYLPPGWLWEDTNLDGTIYSTYTNNMWGTYSSSSYAHTGTMSVREEDCDSSTPYSDDWLFTPSVILNAGTTYTLDWWSRCSSSSYPLTSMEVWIGSANNSAAMTTWLWSNPSMTYTTHQLDTVLFTVPVTGAYNIGFWVNSGSSSDADIYLDDIILYIPGGPIYDQTVSMSNLGSGATSQLNFPDWIVSSPGVYTVVADAQLATDVALYDNILTKDVLVGFVDASLDSIQIPKTLMGPAPFSPKATVNNTGDVDFSTSTVGLLPVHATVADPSGGAGLCFEEDFEGATGVSVFEGDVEVEFPESAIWKSGDYLGGPGAINWPDDQPPFGAPGDWTILNPDDNGAIWHVTDYRSSSPDQSMYCGDEITKVYLPDSMDIMISPKIHVGTAGGDFAFDIYNDVEGGYQFDPPIGDFVAFGASPDGISFAWYWFGDSWWASWAAASGVPIPSSYVDSNGDCYIAFMFRSDSSYEYEGVYIDNVEVYGSPFLYDETVYVNLAAGNELEIDFPTFTPLDGYEDYTIEFCCESPDDSVPANDCDSLVFTTGAPVYVLETGWGYLTIQDAIDDAEEGQTVVATDGTYYEDIVIDKGVTVTGENVESTPYKDTCTWDHIHGSFIKGTVTITANDSALQKFDIDPMITFDDHDAAVKVFASGVTVQQNTIHNVRGLVESGYWTIKGIHVYGGPSSPHRNILIQNNTIRDIINENVSGGGGSTGTLLEEGFEGTFPPTGWTLESKETYTDPWTQTSNAHSGSYAAQGNYGTSSESPTDEWLITPTLDLSPGNGELTFWRDFDAGSSNYPDVFEVLLSEDDGSSWPHSLMYLDWNDPDDPGYVEVIIDLSSYTSATTKIAFRYWSDWGYSSYIDDVTVTVTAGGPTGGYGGATGVMVQGYVSHVDVLNNRIEDIHSAGWCYGTEVTTTASTTLSAPTFDEVFYESDFESDDGGWVATASWDPVGDWAWTDSYDVSLWHPDGDGSDSGTPPPAAHSGDGLWATDPFSDHENSGGETWLSQTFDFSGLQGTMLRFWSWPDGFMDYDYCYINVNGDEVFYDEDYAPTDWSEEVIDLSAYDDMDTVEIQFGFHASTVVSYAGWYIDDVTITAESGVTPPGPQPKDVVINCNYFSHIGDGSSPEEYDVWNSTGAPYPGVMVTIDETTTLVADPMEVTLKCNYFDPDCYKAYAVVNKNMTSPLDATLNYWGVPDGPDVAGGFGALIAQLGDVFFEPWLGVNANIKKPMGETITIEAGDTVNFDGEGSFAYCFDGCEECCSPAEQELQFLWDFDDGAYSSNKAPTYEFKQPGTYRISLRVDAAGFAYMPGFMYDWDYITVNVEEAAEYLQANADGGNLGGYEATVFEPITLYGSAIGGEAPYIYVWDFGDGSDKQTTEGTTVVYKYRTAGEYTVTLTVYDYSGQKATDTSEVTVYGIEELLVNIGGSMHVAKGDTAEFTSTVTGGFRPYSYHWNFGDGVVSNEANPRHVYENSGTYTVTLTVNDAMDNQKTKTTTVEVKTTETSEVEISSVKGGLLLSATITSDESVAWAINVEGLVLLGGQEQGTAEGVTQVKLPFTLAFGKVDITISAGNIEKHYNAFMLGPFVLNLKEA